MFAIELALYGVIGIVAGLLAGLLGISGGIITVPLLALVFSHTALPQSSIMHLAVGTSLAAMVFNGLSATWAHHQKNGVVWNVFSRMAVGIILGSLCGAFVAHLLPDALLEGIFGFFACVLALYMLRKKAYHGENHPLPGTAALNSLGFCVSGIANVLGIGGGILTVPALMHFKMQEKQAIGTSAATGTLVSFLGAVSYMIFGLQQESVVNGKAVGYLYLPAFIAISVTTFIAAPYGARLAHVLPSKTLRRIFAAALFATGLMMLML